MSDDHRYSHQVEALAEERKALVALVEAASDASDMLDDLLGDDSDDGGVQDTLKAALAAYEAGQKETG